MRRHSRFDPCLLHLFSMKQTDSQRYKALWLGLGYGMSWRRYAMNNGYIVILPNSWLP